MGRNAECLDALYEGFWNRGAWHAGADVVAPDIEWRGIETDPALAGMRHGAREVNRWFGEWLEAWDTVSVNWETEELTPDLLLVHCWFRFRGKGSGMEIDSSIGQIWEFRDGRATRQTMYRTHAEARQAAEAVLGS